MKIGHTQPNGTTDTRDIVLGGRSIIVGLVLLMVPGILSFLIQSTMRGQDVEANTAVNITQQVELNEHGKEINNLNTAKVVMETNFAFIREGIEDIKETIK